MNGSTNRTAFGASPLALRALMGIALLTACGANAGDTPDAEVAGMWTGLYDVDSPVTMMLSPASGALRGRICLGRNATDCSDFDTASIDGDRLQFMYSWVERGRRERVEGDLRVHGASMSGTLFSTKCACTFSLALNR